MSKPSKPYDVGRGKPPVHSRFPKGASGNPSGRPKKIRPGHIPLPHEPFTMQMILESAFSPLTQTNPDGSTRQITSVEAVLQALKIKAIKGNTYAQGKYLDYIQKVEADRVGASMKLFTFYAELKMDREMALRKWIASGRQEGDLVFHPEDIQIDPETLHVKWRTPLTLEDHENLKSAIEIRDKIAELFHPKTGLATIMKEFPGLVDDLQALEEKYEEANAILPTRFRKARPDYE